MLLASQGGSRIFWREVVVALSRAFDYVISVTSMLMRYMNTPLSELAENMRQSHGAGLVDWLLSVLLDILDFFGVSITDLTPFELMLGPLIPVILFLAIYHFFKR